MLTKNIIHVSPGETEKCCQEDEIGLPGPKGEPGSSGKLFRCYKLFLRKTCIEWFVPVEVNIDLTFLKTENQFKIL